MFEAGEEAVAGLTTFAEEQGLKAAHFAGLGALQRATVGFFERASKDYSRIELDEQVEVLSLVGNVARAGDSVKVHAHAVLGKRHGTADGGHPLEARVWPTSKVILGEEPRALRRRSDSETGLPLLDLPRHDEERHTFFDSSAAGTRGPARPDETRSRTELIPHPEQRAICGDR